MRFLMFLLAASLLGCGDDDSMDAGADSGVDAPSVDAPSVDAPSVDAPLLDAPVADAPDLDSGDDDAGLDDAATDAPADTSLPFDADGACHALGFGEGVVTLESVGALPDMTGGEITLGSWDLVAVQTTGALTGTAQGTWTFETADTLQTLGWLALSGEPPAPTPRTETWSTEGSNLVRMQTCGGSESFNTGYTVRSAGGATLLDVRSGTVMFTYQRR